MLNKSELLSSALENCNICALHIDLQEVYWTNAARIVRPAFAQAHQLAKHLQQNNTANFWIARTQAALKPTKASQYKECTDKTLEALHYEVPDTDLILPKQENDLFHQRDLVNSYDPFDYLTQTMGIDTFLITGVLSQHCVAATITGAFKRAAEKNKDINIVVVDQAVNHKGTVEDYVDWIKDRKDVPQNMHHRLTHTTIEEVKQAIDSIALAA